LRLARGGLRRAGGLFGVCPIRNLQGEGEMSTFLMAAVRCDCGGKLGWGRRWVHVCEGCGRRWGLRDGVFGPLDREDPVRRLGDGTPEESALLVCFRRLPGPLRAELLSQVQALARSTDGVL
jgi:hypothetical protein